MCVDETYDNDAPPDGLDILMAEGRRPDHLLLRSDVVTYWAVRVAQELAEWRRGRLAGVGDSAATLLAHAKLDLALQGAFDRLGDRDRRERLSEERRTTGQCLDPVHVD
jgi:hypothetical protein